MLVPTIQRRKNIIMTTEFADRKKLAKELLSRKDYRPFPKYDDRNAWANVNSELRARYLNDDIKKKILEYESSALVATGYMDLYRTGRRGGRPDGRAQAGAALSDGAGPIIFREPCGPRFSAFHRPAGQYLEPDAAGVQSAAGCAAGWLSAPPSGRAGAAEAAGAAGTAAFPAFSNRKPSTRSLSICA